jgi:hypothetical protein
MKTVLLVLMLGTPQFFFRFTTETDCVKKSHDYTAMETKKRPNMLKAECVTPDSPLLNGILDATVTLKRE